MSAKITKSFQDQINAVFAATQHISDEIIQQRDDALNATVIKMRRQLDEAQVQKVYDLMEQAWRQGLAHGAGAKHTCDGCNPYERQNRLPLNAKSYRCPNCGWVSHNPNDVAFSYCGNCRTYNGTRMGPAPDTQAWRQQEAPTPEGPTAARLKDLQEQGLLDYAPLDGNEGGAT